MKERCRPCFCHDLVERSAPVPSRKSDSKSFHRCRGMRRESKSPGLQIYVYLDTQCARCRSFIGFQATDLAACVGRSAEARNLLSHLLGQAKNGTGDPNTRQTRVTRNPLACSHLAKHDDSLVFPVPFLVPALGCLWKWSLIEPVLAFLVRMIHRP